MDFHVEVRVGPARADLEIEADDWIKAVAKARRMVVSRMNAIGFQCSQIDVAVYNPLYHPEPEYLK